MLEIAPEKVAHIILKAREYDSKVAAWDDTSRSGDAEDDPSSILEDFTNDLTRVELAAFIDRLNVDEQVHLARISTNRNSPNNRPSSPLSTRRSAGVGRSTRGRACFF